jgi:HlyD family secretion protein
MRYRVLRPLGLVLTAAVIVAAVLYAMGGSSTPTPEARRVVKAGVGDVNVTVRGVGRIVPSGPASSLVPAAAASDATATGGGGQGGGQGGGTAAAPPGAVFPRASGIVSRLLVRSGDQVVAGQRVAVLDDAGAAGAVVEQSASDVETARVELKKMVNPLSPADVSALTLEARKATADLEALRGGTPRDRARAVRIARRNVALARHRLHLVQHPRTAADVAAAEAEVRKAEADLTALLDPPLPPSQAELSAAQAAVQAANVRLASVSAPAAPAAVSAARLDVEQATADLTQVQQQTPPASAQEIAAAVATLDAARAKLDALLAPPNATEVAIAVAELRRAEADLNALLTPAPPSSASSVAAARQALVSARIKVLSLRLPPPPADVVAARLELDHAVSDLQTLRAGPSTAALAAAKAAIASAHARVASPSNPLDVELAKVGVTAAGTRLFAARLSQELLTVRAVSAGTVTSVYTSRGSPVDPSTPVVAVRDLERLAVDVDISEFDAAQVKRGMRAVLSVDALGGKPVPGAVLDVAPTGGDAGGVVTFPVRVSISVADGLRAGMNVSVRIVVDERRHVVQVPLEAVRGSGGRRLVQVLGVDGRVTRRHVRLGLANNKSIEVVDGLRAGERVVLAGSGGGGGE